MKFKIMSANDCIGEYNHPTVPTAINNFKAFTKHWKTENSENPSGWKYLKDIEDFSNDQDLDHLPTIEEIIEEYIKDPDKFRPYVKNGQKKRRMFPCRILASQTWSSEKSIYDENLDSTGYDRPITQTMNQSLHLSHLRQKDKETSESKGFTNHDCMMLAGLVRIKHCDDKIEVTITKPEGNGRIVKGLITSKGEDMYFPYQVSFHEENLSEKEMHKVEAKMHHTDAEERSTQNESQKFSSGYNAGVPEYVFCYNFLWELELDFDGVMNAKRKAQGLKPWKQVSSISMINRGENEGMFKKAKNGITLHPQQPGYEFTRLAHIVAKKMAEKTKEDIIFSSAIQAIASMFHSLCQDFNRLAKNPSSKGPLFTEQQLEDYLIQFAEDAEILYNIKLECEKIQGRPIGVMKDTFKLKDLALTPSTKSIEAICVRVFWKDKHITNWWMNIKKSARGFSEENPNIIHFVNKCKDPATKTEMKRTIAAG